MAEKGQTMIGGGDTTGRGMIGGKAVRGAPGDTIMGPKDRWEPGAIPERAAHSEADDSVSLDSISQGAR